MDGYVSHCIGYPRRIASDPRGDRVSRSPRMPLDRDLAAALTYSRFATQSIAAHPEDADWLAACIDAPAEDVRAGLAEPMASDDGQRLAAALRVLRRRTLLRTLARDLTGRADLDEVCRTMTALAETSLAASVSMHHRALAAVHGEPRDEEGAPQELVVIAMGKLGGGELNVSSDVDLVFVYPDDGETDGSHPVSNREFFDKLGRRVIGALGDVTADGFVFRVDMRLRPYGESGPLTVPFAALEQYLITQGRAWERYAWLKARPLTGSRHDELMAHVTPFVFRKYLDYDAYEGLRDIHRQIREQVKRRDYAPDLKLGPGGIREIEFIVQALQIVRGGREPALRVRSTRAGARGGRRTRPSARRGRRVAGGRVRLSAQRRASAPVPRRPSDPAPARRSRASGRHWRTRPDLRIAIHSTRALARHRDAVSAQFDAAFGGTAIADRNEAGAGATDELAPLAALWRGDLGDCRRARHARSRRIRRSRRTRRRAARFRASSRYVALPALSQQRVDDLVPRLLHVAATERVDTAAPQTVFQRLFDLLGSVSRRSAYLALLAEHPPLLPRLAQLMGASSWAADYLTRHPLLLDELLDARVLLAAPDWDAWRAELARLIRDHDGDPERQMDALRHFRQAQAFRLLAQDLAGLLTVERLADHLSALADAILAATLAAVWAQMGGHLRCAAEIRDRRLRKAGGQGARICVGPRSRVPPRRRGGGCTRALRAARAADDHVAHRDDGRRERSTTSTCACVPTARPA